MLQTDYYTGEWNSLAQNARNIDQDDEGNEEDDDDEFSVDGMEVTVEEFSDDDNDSFEDQWMEIPIEDVPVNEGAEIIQEACIFLFQNY